MLLIFFSGVIGPTIVIEILRINHQEKQDLSSTARNLVDLIEQRLESTANTIKRTAKSPLTINSLIHVNMSTSYFEHSLKDLSFNTDIVNAAVFDYTGNILSSNNEDTDWFKTKMTKLTLAMNQEMFLFENGILYFIEPINYHNTTQGGIIASIDFDDLVRNTIGNKVDSYEVEVSDIWKKSYTHNNDNKIRQTARNANNKYLAGYDFSITIAKDRKLIRYRMTSWLSSLGILSLIGIATMVFIARKVGQKMASPILLIATKVNEGTHPISPTNTDDELEILAKSFDDATIQLINVNRELEQRVRERTAQLETQKSALINSNIALEKNNKELENSNAELDKYAFVASHDLKSPLQSISQLAGWITEDCEDLLPEPSKRHIHLLRERIDRMQKLLADLLMFSRIGREEYTAESVNIEDLAEKAFSFNALPNSFSLETIDCDINVILPRIPLELTLRNLIGNAHKHHHKDSGTIRVSYSLKSDMHIISVVDDGPGIPPELHNKALSMFHTLKSRDEVEGSGLGLSMVKKAVERFGGHLKLISDGATGTTIQTYWPLMKTPS